MSRQLPPIDLHAHVNPSVSATELERLGAVVFAATRSFDQFESTRGRRDQVTIWGLGCHPGELEAQIAFNSAAFVALLPSTAYVSEVGLDRRSRVPMETQKHVLDSILGSLESTPRITSIHSSGASEAVLEALSRHRVRGAVLHWWRGNEAQTRGATELGCWFSVNAAGVRYPTDVAKIPLDRILTETDHPSGDRASTVPRQPGAVGDVEVALARIYGVTPTAMRQQLWSNLARLVDEARVDDLLPAPVRRMLAASRQRLANSHLDARSAALPDPK